MKGTIKRVGKIYQDPHNGLVTQGWEIAPGGDFTLQDLITIASLYPEGSGPFKFGTDTNQKAVLKPVPVKKANTPRFHRHRKRHK
jgi:hypothetical protein